MDEQVNATLHKQEPPLCILLFRHREEQRVQVVITHLEMFPEMA